MNLIKWVLLLIGLRKRQEISARFFGNKWLLYNWYDLPFYVLANRFFNIIRHLPKYLYQRIKWFLMSESKKQKIIEQKKNETRERYERIIAKLNEMGHKL